MRTTISVRLTDAHGRCQYSRDGGRRADIRRVRSPVLKSICEHAFTVYLGNYYVFAVLTIDPGSALSALVP
ncbi:hypothetical protein [Mycobacterium uberis]|uniref:hypothetical protein n=1 Tax=Mycobacterium uberis TaxID=2162698 RepID=UPI0014031281|nr:hypothetical protein [Mycobacterium uberis]